MSLDLEVKLYSPVSLDALATKAHKALCSLLKFSLVGNVLISSSLQSVAFNYTGTCTAVVSGQESDEIELTFVVVPNTPGYEDPDEEGWWAGVTARAAFGAPLKLALAAALAIALAESQQSVITDERRAWTKQRASTPDGFLAEITVPASPASLDEALRLFVAQIDANT